MAGYIGSKSSVTLVDGYTEAEADAEFVTKTGDTMSGDLNVTGTVTSDGLTVTQTGSTTATIGATGTSGDNDGTLIINNGGSGDGMLRFDYETNTDRARIGVSASSQNLQFYTAGNNERMRIDSSGRVTMPYQPAVCAYPTTGTVASGDQNLLPFSNILFNNGNHFNTTTKIFTAPVAGYYFTSAQCRWATGNFVQNNYIRLFISKNDGNYDSARIHVINGSNEAWNNYMAMSCSGVVYCSAGDTLRVKGGMSGGTSEIHSESSFHVYLLG